MKYSFSLFCLMLLFSSCDPGNWGDQPNPQSVALKNESNEVFSVYFYDQNIADPITGLKPLLREIVEINPDEFVIKTINYFESDPKFYFFNDSNNFSDSLVIKFANGKGYYTSSSSGEPTTENWINGKSSLLKISPSDLYMINDVFYYTITEEDYENAFELP